ncbi:LmeA family phospholipid-binding protein [Quadrisphaera oryzae]|uniref:LmeA family phospholipid-binding protein n=1 Tax=Quadrisphaera TaxID=317661 RepID=UPI0016489661|nr:DUF2993 domain-containing protein [Quadrisphaera sp. RL12-1S]
MSRGGRRALGWLVVVAVLLGGALVAAPVLDGAARTAAQERAAAEVARSSGAAGATVTVGGGWFLPQVVRGRYPQVRLDLREVPTQQLTLARVVVDASDVELSTPDLLQGRVTGTAAASRTSATVSYDVLDAVLARRSPPLRVAPETGGDRLRVTGSERVLGRDVALSGWVDLEVDAESSPPVLRAVPDELDVDDGLLDSLSGSVLRRLRGLLAFDVPLGELPDGQRVTGVQVRGDGVVVDTQGEGIVVGS